MSSPCFFRAPFASRVGRLGEDRQRGGAVDGLMSTYPRPKTLESCVLVFSAGHSRTLILPLSSCRR